MGFVNFMRLITALSAFGFAFHKQPPTAFTGKVFISTPEDTGPAYAQMELQHRSRAP